jgi:type II secretory pathway pseudopilin PulG
MSMRSGQNRHAPAAGFTLVEVISVTVVMVLVLTIAVGAHLMWKRHSALDSTATQVYAHLALARQHAITQALPTTFSASNRPLSDNRDAGLLDLDRDLLDPAPEEPDQGVFFVSIARTNGVSTADGDTPPANERTLLGDVVRMPRRTLWITRRTTPEAADAPLLAIDPLHLTFLPDGSCAPDPDTWPDGARDLVLFQDVSDAARTNRLLRRTVRVNPLTGLARTLSREEEATLP